MLDAEGLPEEWDNGIFVALHKKNDRLQCSNYRYLCLQSVGYKLFTLLLFKRLKPYHDTIVDDYQAGFTSGKSTINNIFMLRMMGEKYWEYNHSAWHVFVDFKQAYDSVHRPSLWMILEHFSVPRKLIQLIRACYSNTTGKVRVNGQLTDDFTYQSGLKQGCALSCLLFNIVLEYIMRLTPVA